MNNDIRKTAKESGVYLYAVAAELGVSEPTLIRWLRFELPQEKRERIFSAIAKLKEKKNQDNEKAASVC